ncbi:MAG: hypothetical protein HY033_00710 [Ignavibacteriae bacterium]|nr:hypothetical protein [Ignavibacteria bacterium]MBI3363410.1 hypothetical protein [Ignavibacteriota bacterium]
MHRFDKSILIRIILSIILAAVALGLFLLNQRSVNSNTATIDDSKKRQEELSATLTSIDRDVDSVLTCFGIEKEWIRKKQIPLNKVNLIRTERRVAIPENVLPVTMNLALNAMAKRYNGRAIASENLKENTVTIHVEVAGYIIQTIIVKPTPYLKRGERKQRQVRA